MEEFITVLVLLGIIVGYVVIQRRRERRRLRAWDRWIWQCPACPYFNTGPICTKCGHVR